MMHAFFLLVIPQLPGLPGLFLRPWIGLLPISIVCSNNVSILHHFLDTTTFTEYVTARNLESIFEKKQLRLKATDSFRFMYAHNVVTLYIL